MEILLLLFPLLLLGALGAGGTGGGDEEPPPPDDPRIVEGTDEAETIDRGTEDDLVFAGGGNDTLEGRPGFDILLGDDGDDEINGGPQGDVLAGGAGNDLMFGGFAGDALVGGSGDDTGYGGGGDDELFGISGVDSLFGGSGNDLVSGFDVTEDELDAEGVAGPVAEVIDEILTDRYGAEAAAQYGERLSDGLFDFDAEDRGPDYLYGGSDDDDIYADGSDVMFGGDGVDYFYVVHESDIGAPATVSDFDAANERLELRIDEDAPGVVALADTPEGVLVSVDDLAAVLLAGVGPGQVDLADIAIVRF
jgi:Ca2+-binding RTX toxin-like protein